MGMLPLDLTCSCSWAATSVTLCSNVASLASCCSLSSLISCCTSRTMVLASETWARAGLASMGLPGGWPLPPNRDVPSPQDPLQPPPTHHPPEAQNPLPSFYPRCSVVSLSSSWQADPASCSF